MATTDRLADLRIVWDALDPADPSRSGRFSSLAHYTWGRLSAGVDPEHRTHTMAFEFTADRPDLFRKLPSGRGYTCKQEADDQGKLEHFSVVRHSDADESIFLIFCADLWTSILAQSEKEVSAAGVLSTVLARLAAWQEFMKRQSKTGLTPDEECGLVGELFVLLHLLELGLSGDRALDAWCGPFREIHDFNLDGDAIEVKTSRGNGYGAYTIESEHQLDSSTVRRLQLAAIDLRVDPDGRDLGGWIQAVGQKLPSRLSDLFFERLYRAGVNPASPMCSDEVWAIERIRYFSINDDFPVLTSRNLPNTVTGVRYTLKPANDGLISSSPRNFGL